MANKNDTWTMTHGTGADKLTREVPALAEVNAMLCQGWKITEGPDVEGETPSGKGAK